MLVADRLRVLAPVGSPSEALVERRTPSTSTAVPNAALPAVLPPLRSEKTIVLHQVGINRFATRQQCRDVRRIDHLQVVDGIAADRTRRSHGVGRLLGRHHDALQFQVILGGIKPDRPHPRTHVDLGFGGNEPQAGNDKTRFPGRDSLHREVSVGIGHGPQSGLRQFDDCLSDRLAGILYKHPSRNVETLRRHDSRDNRA